ncbi:hypothetical protein BX600DRAFT_301196 [Xylariales sp. PMI_506]|nr:hypothetical protein BX600DRAFT_301196 [Xylariales sp. PMI_506]
MSPRTKLEQRSAKQPLVDHVSQENPDNNTARSIANDNNIPGNRNHEPVPRSHFMRFVRSRLVIVYITISTMLFQAIFQLAGVAKPAEVTLVFNYILMIAYIAALCYAGELE